MRKGFLAAAALMLGSTSAQAQYWPAQQPYPYHPAANRGVWVMPQQGMPQQMLPHQVMPQQMMPQQMMMPQQAMPQQVPAHYRNNTPRAAYPAYPVGTPNYLPQGYFPAPPMQAIPAPAASTPVPPEPVRVGSTTSAAKPGAATTSRVISYGPAVYLDTLPPPPARLAEAAKEPVVFHRQCRETGWLGGEYLLGWITHGPLGVPLITTGPAVEKGGALTSPGTIVLFGNRDLDFRMLNGLRLEAGKFLDEDNRYSLDVSGFYYLPRHVRYNVRSDANGLPVLGRPVFNVSENDEDVFQLAFPLTDPDAPFSLIGSSSVDAQVQIFGAEVNGRWHSYCRKRLHTEVLVGFRTIHLNESLLIRDGSATLFDDSGLNFKATPLIAGDILIDQDYFETNNRFYGFQVGGKLRWELDKAYFDLFGKVGLGITDQQVRIEGMSTLLSTLGNQSTPGGILALPSNMGDHNRQVFGAVPEVGVNMGVDVSDHLRLKVGYSCLCWSGVVRPGSQIDRAVNPVQIPTDQNFGGAIGAPRPEFQFRETVFFLQSFNFGVEFHF